jgi:malonate decarboxylase epsilon subunit
MSVAFLFPGQGSQRPGMLHALPEHPAVAATLEEASDVLGQDVMGLDEESVLASTVSTQMALYTAGVAVARALDAEDAKPDVVSGLSVGAYAAAATAGAVSFADGLRLVRKRAQTMENMFPSGYGLSAIVGLDEKRVADLVAQATTPEHPIFVGNINALQQIVVAGAVEGLDKIVALATTAGCKKAERLSVRVPSHCPLLEPVAQMLLEDVKGLPPLPVRVQYVSNRRARPTKAGDKIREDIATNIAHSVRWHDATQVMAEMGTTLFVEMNPGHVLANLASASFPQVSSLAMSDSTLDYAAKLVRDLHAREEA